MSAVIVYYILQNLKKKLKTIFIWFCFVFHGCAYFWSVLSRQSDAKKPKKNVWRYQKGLLELEVQTIPMSKKKDENPKQWFIKHYAKKTKDWETRTTI